MKLTNDSGRGRAGSDGEHSCCRCSIWEERERRRKCPKKSLLLLLLIAVVITALSPLLPEAGFLVRVHPEPCLILSRAQIRAL
jgi:hypothetical protein